MLFLDFLHNESWSTPSRSSLDEDDDEFIDVPLLSAESFSKSTV